MKRCFYLCRIECFGALLKTWSLPNGIDFFRLRRPLYRIRVRALCESGFLLLNQMICGVSFRLMARRPPKSQVKTTVPSWIDSCVLTALRHLIYKK